MYKLLILDLDNTLLSSDKSISKLNREAIARAKENGVMVSLATGRCPIDIYHLISTLELEDNLHIGNNGISIFKMNVFSEDVKVFERDYYLYILSELEKNNIPYGVFVEKGFVFEKRDIIEEKISKYMKLTPAILGDTKSLVNPYKVCAYFKDDEQLKYLRSLEKEGQMSGVIPDANILDMMPYGITKYSGALEIAKRLNISRENIIAVGDQENDMELIKGVGLGIAVKNAIPEVKKVADVTLDKTNNEDAIYHVINRYILSDKGGFNEV